jgi:mevalonate kinase
MTYEDTKIESRTNSKVILTGENAVVFGATSVACAIGLDNKCRMDVWKNSFFHVSIGPILARFDKSDAVSTFKTMRHLCESKRYKDVAEALNKRPLAWIQAVLGQLIASGEDFPYFSADIDLAVSLGSGLGGSTTSTILILKALGKVSGNRLSAQSTFDLAYLGDRIAHGGSASGTDSGAIVYGGFVSFKRNKGVKLIRKHLPLELLVCCSRQNKTSGISLAMFRQLDNRDSDWFRRRIQEFDTISEELVELLYRPEELDLGRIGMLMNRNQKLLKEMKVSTSEIDDLVQIGIDRGALGAKLTGGGCGGVVIMVGQSKVLKDIANELKETGRHVFMTRNSPSEENL